MQVSHLTAYEERSNMNMKTENKKEDMKANQKGTDTANQTAENETLRTALPKLAMDEIPTPATDAVSITGLVKKRGRIIGYRLSDDRIVSREEGVRLTRSGRIKGVGIAHKKETEYLKSIPDGSESNNLSSLPTVQTDL